jgi:predicted dehydrogenase/threonine dehydrogenase-like Zn-dependent dehydrogenase
VRRRSLGGNGMKQVLQHARGGEIDVADVPSPKLLPGCVIVQVAASLVSAGTERASSEFAKKNLLQKAKARPDLVRQVFAKFRRDGLFSTVNAVRSRLDQPTALGYSSAGTIIAVAEDVSDIQVGDRVACAGAGYAIHAEFACVPRLLVAKILPESGVSFEEAAFSTVGAVALHGIRTADVKLGDVVGVIGIGLLGQLTVQLLKAAGCHVIALDLQRERAAMAVSLGVEDATESPEHFADLCSMRSSGHGVDAVLITAETSSSDPVNLAATIARDRAVVVAVGTVGMELQRKLYYEKELDFRISRSYGPGRYDSAYEQKGRDYPIGYVRWTETRNMEAFLRLLAEKRVDVRPLITHRFDIEDAHLAYQQISRCVADPTLGVLITYSSDMRPERTLRMLSTKQKSQPAKVRVGVLGAGSFATGILIPAMRQESATELVAVCSATGSHSRSAAQRFGFQYCTADENEILSDPSINTVVIATRHHLHARQIAAALSAGKHVFCEKPLCLNESELADLVSLYQSRSSQSVVMVGLNRRFAPMATRLKEFVSETNGPMTMHYRVNAGSISPDHWVNDPEQGGGRLVGEACHFIDLLSFLIDSPPLKVETRAVGNINQSLVITVQFANGSHGTISYLVDGDRSFSKERLEIFGGGGSAVLEDFRLLEMVRGGRRTILRSRFRHDKGHRAEWQAFAQAIQNGSESPIPFDAIVSSTLATFRAVDARCSGKSMIVDINEINIADDPSRSCSDIPPRALKVESC